MTWGTQSFSHLSEVESYRSDYRYCSLWGDGVYGKGEGTHHIRTTFMHAIHFYKHELGTVTRYCTHTQWHHFKYHFYRLCANETDLLSVVILSFTAAIIALQPAHHKVSMNNI